MTTSRHHQARRALVIGLLTAIAATLTVILPAPAPRAAAVPVADDDTTYAAYGRAFPDPHGCVKGAPNTSPWAKGNVCATQFIQFDEALDGLRYLEQRYGRYVQLINLHEQYGDHPELTMEDLQTAGIPKEDLSREREDLWVVKVTDRESPVPEADRRHFAYSLSIHGIERAGIEGGIRAIEDIVTWAACEDDPAASSTCAAEGPFPKPILEPSGDGPTASEVTEHGVVYFVLANPDGWKRGDVTKGGVFYQRYNGNGMDLNRDFPTIGYTEAQYTPFSEPETRGFGRFLELVKNNTSEGRFAGAIDLHGMVTAPAFSFTLLGAGQRDYRKNAITVDTAIRTFRDSEERLSWSSLIAPSDDCPGEIEEPVYGGTLPMCSDQWGTVWDTINYQVTGSFGDWMDSPIGLDGVGIDNEMALSHLAPDTAFVPEVEQLHIDGNKGLIYAQIASLLFEDPVRFDPAGRIAYVDDPDRTTNPGGGDPGNAPFHLPTQADIRTTQVNGLQSFTFDVQGPGQGFYNGGLTIEATFGNIGGVSPNTAADLVLEYCGGADHAGDEEECREVARYFNQSFVYLQGGARIDLNNPRPGPYRIRTNPGRALPTELHVSFSRGPAYPEPEQAAYDVSRTDFFSELNDYVAPGEQLVAVSVEDVLADPAVLAGFDTVVVADDFMPGFAAAGPAVEPGGAPQAGESFAFTAADGAPGVGAVHDFEVLADANNDTMVVDGHWELPSDYDLHVEQLVDGTWQARGCECAFVNNGERVEIIAPAPGSWRVRLENFAAAPQDVSGTIEFTADPVPPAGPASRWTTADYDRYAHALAGFAGRGGNLVLTDGALTGLPSLGTGLPPDAVQGGYFYAGWMDFDDGEGETYDRHHLAAGVNKEGTAEGKATVDGTAFEHRHQTFEPTPLGFFVSPSGASNSNCTSDKCDSPNWIVDPGAWAEAGGTVAARTLVRESVSPGSPATTGVSLGELTVGEGRIRVAGALLPEPSTDNYHPYGIASYALTYTGYQLFENLVDWQAPTPPPPPPPPATRPGPPRGLQGTPGNRSVALRWRAPADDGGAEVTGYRTRCASAKGDHVRRLPATGTTRVVRKLVNDTRYRCAVRALNTEGLGPWSREIIRRPRR
jgi:hypothetical protein